MWCPLSLLLSGMCPCAGGESHLRSRPRSVPLGGGGGYSLSIKWATVVSGLRFVVDRPGGWLGTGASAESTWTGGRSFGGTRAACFGPIDLSSDGPFPDWVAGATADRAWVSGRRFRMAFPSCCTLASMVRRLCSSMRPRCFFCMASTLPRAMSEMVAGSADDWPREFPVSGRPDLGSQPQQARWGGELTSMASTSASMPVLP